MFDGQSFLDFARACATQHRTEASDRTVISRAYYAVFWLARDYCVVELNTSISSGPGAHQEVFRTIEAAKGNQFAGRIRRLHRLRKRADYEAGYRDSSADVQFAIDEANELSLDLSLS